MEPWQSWAIAIAGGGFAYYYYVHQGSNSKSAKNRSPTETGFPTAAKAITKREDRATRKNVQPLPARQNERASSGDDAGAAGATRKRKAPRESKTPIMEFPPTSVSDLVDREDDGNQAWAQQLADLRKGTSLNAAASKENVKKAARTVKQSASAAANAAIDAAAKVISPDTASQSSADAAGGADGDSQPVSHQAGDVSDMLEAPAAGPSVLRLTPSNTPEPASKPKKQKEFEPALSKKQRQNRRKVEERKLDREADEQERKILLEKQRRTAREARGEPAKNGLSKPPASNAWAAGGRQTVPAGDSSVKAPLLDTFERAPSAVPAAQNGTSRQENWESEDAQMRLATQLSSDESGWATVSTKKKARKPTQTSDGENSDYAGSVNVPSSNARVEQAAVIKPAVAHKSIYADLVAQSDSLESGSHPDDSQWAA